METTTPKRKKRPAYLSYTEETNAADALLTAAQSVRELADEMTSWRDNMSGTGLENTSKYEMVDEAASALETLADELENIETSPLETIEETVTVGLLRKRNTRKSGESRAVRLSNAESYASAAKDVVDTKISELQDARDKEGADEDSIDETISSLEEIQTALDNLDWTVDFPGMFG